MDPNRSICRHCRYTIVRQDGGWFHMSGSNFCLDKNGFTATPFKQTSPVLELGVL